MGGWTEGVDTCPDTGGGRGVQGYERCVCVVLCGGGRGVGRAMKIRCWEGVSGDDNVGGGGVLEGGGMKGCRGIWEVVCLGGGDEGRGTKVLGKGYQGMCRVGS